MSAFLYPVMLDITGRRCLVVGGGAAAEGKAIGLVEAGARVTVVSPSLSRGLLDLAADGRFHWWPREYASGDGAGFFLVMAATDDPAVNSAVTAEVRSRGGLVNSADDLDGSDFLVPSVLRRGPLTVAISTGGTSPVMAGIVREEIESFLPSDYGRLTEVVADARRVLRARGRSIDLDRWRRAVDQELRHLVAAGRAEEAQRRLIDRLGA